VLTSREAVLGILSDRKPRASRELIEITKMSEKTIENVLRRLWEEEILLRTDKAIHKFSRNFKGRSGMRQNMRNFHLYVLNPDGLDTYSYQGVSFVKFDAKYLDVRGGMGGVSKAKVILNFLKDNREKAFYTTEIVDALKDRGVKPSDVITNIRRYEKKGLVYLRGYKTGENETPFQNGFIVTYLDGNIIRDDSIREAVKRTDQILLGTMTRSPIIERIQRVRDIVISYTQLKEIVSHEFLLNKLGCSKSELDYAIKRTMQLYSDIKMVKLFDFYAHFYHESFDEKELHASIELRKNYLRKTGGSKSRVGHNWEAAVSFFIDQYTDAEFMTQTHRNQKMDNRRITIHLVKPVASRRHNAEVDRCWSITPSILSKPITYCLEAKYGVVMKKHVDDFLNILKNSKEFGYDTEKGREIKAGVIPVFAGGTFNPNEKIFLEKSPIDLFTYAQRMNVQLLRASDLNKILAEKGINIKECSVHKICKVAKNEREVKEILLNVLNDPKNALKTLRKVSETNNEIYEFEKMLEEPNSDF